MTRALAAAALERRRRAAARRATVAEPPADPPPPGETRGGVSGGARRRMALARSTCERFSGRGDQRGAERAAAGQGGVGEGEFWGFYDRADQVDSLIASLNPQVLELEK